MLVSFAYVVALAARGVERLSVLDWGGGLGHYEALARSTVPGLELDWHVKETPAVAARGRPGVTFHTDEQCLSDRSYDLVVASSSLQYEPEWQRLLSLLAGAAGRYLYVARVPVALTAPSFVVIQRPYVHGYDTEYLGWVLNRDELVEAAGLPARARVPARRAVLGRRRAGGSGRSTGASSSIGSAMSIYADLYRYRELFANLFRRDLQTRYKGSYLGVFWSLLNPLLLMGIYVLVFSVLWKAAKIPHYALYVLVGLVVWVFVSTSLTMASRSLVAGAPLVKKVRFPRQLVPLSSVATQLVTYVAMLACTIVAVADRHPGHAEDLPARDPALGAPDRVRRRALAGDRLRERGLPRRGAPRHRGALAVVLPHARALQLRPAAGELPAEVDHRPHVLGQSADARRSRRCAPRSTSARCPTGGTSSTSASRRSSRSRSGRGCSGGSTTGSPSSSSAGGRRSARRRSRAPRPRLGPPGGEPGHLAVRLERREQRRADERLRKRRVAPAGRAIGAELASRLSIAPPTAV